MKDTQNTPITHSAYKITKRCVMDVRLASILDANLESNIEQAFVDVSTKPTFFNDLQPQLLLIILQADLYQKMAAQWMPALNEANIDYYFLILYQRHGQQAFENIDKLETIKDHSLIINSDVTAQELKQIINFSFRCLAADHDNKALQSRLLLNTRDIRRITTIGQALATEHDFGRLISLILMNAKEVVSADGGSIYLTERKPKGDKPTHIRFMRSSMQLDADEFLLPINAKSIAGYVALRNQSLVIDDVRKIPSDAEYSFNSEFDKAHGYYTKSMMVIPMANANDEVIGVLQLVNCKKNYDKKLTIEDMMGDEVVPFSNKDYELVSAMAGQAAVTIENQRLIDEQKELLEGFIQLIAGAIDSKSPYTGGHCKRVPIITQMLAQEACQSHEEPFKDFQLSEEEWHELNIAAWLHDCGKVTTPVHIMDKGTKLETIFDRIELVKARLQILRQQFKIESLEAKIAGRIDVDEEYSRRVTEVDEIEEFLTRINSGGEYLAPEKIEQIKRIANIQIQAHQSTIPLLNEEEVANLSISKGTLTEEERLIINGHIVETIKMLESLPFPKNLRKVPEYAGGHHEKMDGKGYPRGVYGIDMSIPARIMAIADVFEALTAPDRPYKKAKKLSETMRIMGFMKKENHLDPDLFNLFVQSGLYKKYSQKFLDPSLIDDVDEQHLLNIQPDPYILPDKLQRQAHSEKLLPEFRTLYENAASYSIGSIS